MCRGISGTHPEGPGQVYQGEFSGGVIDKKEHHCKNLCRGDVERLKIALGSDHGGYQLKEEIKRWLTEKGEYEVRDFGTYSEGSCDYPDVALPVARAVAQGECSLGILVCGTGIGVSIVANKVPGIRAALCHDTYSARMSRAHNDANILALGARVIGPGLAQEIIRAFLAEPFQGGRHQGRLRKISELEVR